MLKQAFELQTPLAPAGCLVELLSGVAVRHAYLVCVCRVVHNLRKMPQRAMV